MISTDNLLQQQCEIIQRSHLIKNDYEKNKNSADARLKQENKTAETDWDKEKGLIEARWQNEKDDIENKWKQTSVEADNALQSVRSSVQSVQGMLNKKKWDDRLAGGVPHSPTIPADASLLRQIESDQSAAKSISGELHTSLGSFGWNTWQVGAPILIGIFLPILLPIFLSLSLQDYLTDSSKASILIWSSILAGISIALLVYSITYILRARVMLPGLRDAYATLLQAGNHAEEIYKQIMDTCSVSESQLNESQARYRNAIDEVDRTYQRLLRENEARYTETINQLNQKKAVDVASLKQAWSNFAREAGFGGLSWDDSAWSQWQPSQTTTGFARLGTLTTGLPNEIPPVPALIECPGNQNILFKTGGHAKDNAIAAIQSLMLRLLATQLPGKVRFTLFDPIGLGQNVATFMQLTDYDEKLVNSRVWTEPRHIEHQLADLSEHMETVIQKYLRGQYRTIEEYNEQAGEVAEPYRVLVVIGFPMNFTEETAHRLVKIATNGPRCGVSTIVLLDTGQAIPHGINMGELERISTVITLDTQHATWQDEDFKNCQLQLDKPPELKIFNSILQRVGEEAKLAEGVKVPFERIVPPVQEWWKGSTREGLKVPLGRAGATKLQSLDLGKGTAQHALVVGKTGSGKTTLLHILITNLCLTYSPDELELYLVDFKTVGFTPYAAYRLPHARVVAIQSEREFGLSVLQGLDAELERRKQLYSKAGVQDFAQYRGVQPNVRMPRILLLVDEFQEFFTQDDRVAHDATLLLDRLVRQGRAFGIHVMLGSQTLAGSYSLARATIGQMAVRIALQCEETDSRLVLSDDNPAARLLSRPGEAIYNSANGLVEGNNPFQCSWLPDDELDTYLVDIQRFAEQPEQRHYQPTWKQIIFDGSKDGDVTKNTALQSALKAPTWSSPQKTTPIWLGDPIAIKEPTSALIRSQAGNNLLIVGQQEEAALGMMLTALISLAGQYKPRSADFYVADFSPVDASYAGLFSKVAQILQHEIKVVGRRDLPKVITHIADEVQDCIEAGEGKKIPTYLLFYGLQRARDLRPSEDFGFSSFGSDSSTDVSTAKQFTTILREGPELGVHTFAWCDTLANLNRTLERGALREFDIRVAFQMSQEDSSSLIDSPAANKLGSHRALLFNEETGGVEKFRPYGLPTEEWLTEIATYIRQKQ